MKQKCDSRTDMLFQDYIRFLICLRRTGENVSAPMAATIVKLLLLLVSHVAGEPTSRSMMLHIEADQSFSPLDLSTLLSQRRTITPRACAHLCLLSHGCQVASYNASDSSCSIYSVNVLAGTLLSSLSDTSYLVMSVFPLPSLGKM